MHYLTSCPRGLEMDGTIRTLRWIPKTQILTRTAKEPEVMTIEDLLQSKELAEEYRIVSAYIEKNGTADKRSELAELEMLRKVLECAQMMSKLEKLLCEVAEYSEEGKQHAAKGFLDMAERSIKRLNAFKSSTLQKVACDDEFWPMLVMKDPPDAMQTAQANYLKEIGLGENVGFSVRRLWKKTSQAKFVATLLYQAIQGQRAARSIPKDSPWPEAHAQINNAASRSMLMAWRELNGDLESDPVHGKIFVEQLEGLPDFSEATFDEWYKCCMSLLVFITRDAFHKERHGLFSLGSARSKAKGADHTIAPGHLREGIKTALKKAMRSLLPIPS